MTSFFQPRPKKKSHIFFENIFFEIILAQFSNAEKIVEFEIQKSYRYAFSKKKTEKKNKKEKFGNFVFDRWQKNVIVPRKRLRTGAFEGSFHRDF
jgi:hypothetical protein